jgi:hypothetical protein
MSAEDLTSAIAAKERELQQARLRLEALGPRLADSERRCTELRQVLGEGDDGFPLPMLPLVAALVGAVAANGAVFFAFVEILTKFHELVWNASLALALLLGFGSIPLAKRPGAGGPARLGLRRLTIVGVGVAMVGVAAAILRAAR